MYSWFQQFSNFALVAGEVAVISRKGLNSLNASQDPLFQNYFGNRVCTNNICNVSLQ